MASNSGPAILLAMDSKAKQLGKYDDIHVVSRNASSTKPAKFLVFLIKEKGAPLVIPAK